MSNTFYDEKKFEKYDEEDFFKSTIDLDLEIHPNDQKTSKNSSINQNNEVFTHPTNLQPQDKGFFDYTSVITNYLTTTARQRVSDTITNKIKGFNIIRKYFDVELEEIKEKLKYSFLPYSSRFQSLAEKNPDLYGPFWIFATLVYIVAVAGNISNYIDSTGNEFIYDFDFVPSSACYIYGIGFGFPILLTILMKCFLTEISFVQIICYYGYSFSILAPILILCIIPSHTIKWLLLTYAMLSSTTFLVYNIWKEISKYVEKNRYYVILLIAFFQTFLLFVLKTHFFKI